MDTFEHRSLGVLLTLFGLIAALPIIGDLPGMSILLGTLILVVIAESLAGRGTHTYQSQGSKPVTSP